MSVTLLCDWPACGTPYLTEAQQERFEALERGCDGVWMSPQDAALTALGEGWGLALTAMPELIEAASGLANEAVRETERTYRLSEVA